ncbi:sulfur oxidation c-type cytochrome SoxA [Methyloprofundus sedimenti]|uniref:SoxAX cytochrome complex subunit A n=2 Tax=Methyloprofundus sedimenti TaxID=1420851 RepID=A0A1V8M316_9GAMM|nr:sulfur oxidation c-type cytochrome SoxA [Methyloprofundus sedimenti]
MISCRLNAAIAAMVFCLIFFSASTPASPTEDRQQIRAFYQQLFPQLTLDDYAQGVYAIDPDAKASWLAIEEFPPYELALEKGEALFKRPFANGSGYADCFANKGISIAQNYPYWDKQKQQIVTLASALNECRKNNQLSPLTYGKGEINYLLAYMAFTSRGQRINTRIPDDSPAALAAYQQGKAYFYQRRGQLNFSCASCHLDNAGKYIRSEILSPALGHTTHWPAYRLNTGEMGTLHRRFMVCNKLIRAPVDPAQSTALRQLEYYLSFMDFGLPLNGPSTRK